ncbi:MAG: hypothetical protein U0324_21105 [Polyangiales bacterium]
MTKIGNGEGSLSQEERRQFGAYIIRSRLGAAFGGTPPPLNLTVTEILERQRSFEAERRAAERRAAEEARAAEERRQAEIQAVRAAINAQVQAIEFEDADFMNGRPQAQLNFRVHVTNSGNKPIRGARGTFLFYDTFGQVVARLNASVEQDLNAGASLDTILSKHYNQFMDVDRTLRGYNLARGRVVWEPAQVVFGDGTQIQVSGAQAE